MKKRKVARRKKNDLRQAEEFLIIAGTLTKEALSLAERNDPEASRRLAGVSQCQNVALKSLCAAVDKVHKALQKLKD
jgi:hypothetical protein